MSYSLLVVKSHILGINGDVLIDGKHSERWKIYSFEFKSDFIEQ